MRCRLLPATLIACTAFSACVAAPSPELKLPVFTQLRAQATESVDITLGPLPMKIASWLANDHDGGDDDDAKKALQSLQSLRVQHYEFASDYVYSRAEVDAVRSQLASAGWSQVTRVHDHKKDQDVDVFLCLDRDRITGVAIVASEPREFTIVNAVGSLDLQQVARLRQKYQFDHHAAADDHQTAPLL
jgi:hypothetical protein